MGEQIDYKELYIQTLASTLPKNGRYDISSGNWICYTGRFGYAAFDATLKEKVYYDYLGYTDEQVQEEFKKQIDKL